MQTVYPDISSCICHTAARVASGRRTVATMNETFADNRIHHPYETLCLEDLSTCSIFLLPLPHPIYRHCLAYSGATSGERCIRACVHLDYGRVP